MENQVVKVTRESVVKIIFEIKDEGKFFSCKFIKRTTGELREMICRGGVSKFCKGGELAFVPSEKALIGVWEASNPDPKKAYRFIPYEGILEVKSGGITYKVIDKK
jgi:hypothetical protein